MRIINIFCVLVVLLAGCESRGVDCAPGYPDCPTEPQPQPESKQ